MSNAHFMHKTPIFVGSKISRDWISYSNLFGEIESHTQTYDLSLLVKAIYHRTKAQPFEHPIPIIPIKKDNVTYNNY